MKQHPLRIGSLSAIIGVMLATWEPTDALPVEAPVRVGDVGTYRYLGDEAPSRPLPESAGVMLPTWEPFDALPGEAPIQAEPIEAES